MQPFRKVFKKALVLLVAAIVLFLLFAKKAKHSGIHYFSDMLFMVSTVYLVAGLYNLIWNLGMFNTFKYGMRQFFSLITGRKEKVSDKMEGGYLEYVRSRPVKEGTQWMFLLAAFFLIFSVLVSFLFNKL